MSLSASMLTIAAASAPSSGILIERTPAEMVLVLGAAFTALTLLVAPAAGQQGAGSGAVVRPPVRLAEAVRDFDGDGRADTLAVVMTEGRRYRDTQAWCGRGEKYEGEFAVHVRLTDGRTTERSLPFASFFWAGDWSVEFSDYDGDGRPDFNLGQYRSCVGSAYRLYTVESSGRIRSLLPPSREVPVQDFRNSTDRIRVTEEGIKACRYDRSRGALRVRYRWDADRGVFVRAGERQVDGCPEPRKPEAAKGG